MTFECLPTYQYRVREDGRAITSHANLTRGQFNACETGRFIGYIHTLNHKDIDVLMECQKCGDGSWWDTLSDVEEQGLAECENCGSVCAPGVYTGVPA
jgi:hypothetical protein